jgi:ribosomal protein L32E
VVADGIEDENSIVHIAHNLDMRQPLQMCQQAAKRKFWVLNNIYQQIV